MKTLATALFLSILAPTLSQAALITTATGNGADSYIRGNQPTTNFGTSSVLRIKNAVPNVSGNNNRKTYLKFDLSSFGSTAVTNARLSLTIGDAPTGVSVNGAGLQSFAVYGLFDNDPGETWLENSINWNNAPGNDSAALNGLLSNTSLLGNFTINGDGTAGASVSLSNNALASFLNADTNDLATFIILRTTLDANGSGYVHNFASKEHATLTAPSLEINYSTAVNIPGTAMLGLFGLLLIRPYRRAKKRSGECETRQKRGV